MLSYDRNIMSDSKPNILQRSISKPYTSATFTDTIATSSYHTNATLRLPQSHFNAIDILQDDKLHINRVPRTTNISMQYTNLYGNNSLSTECTPFLSPINQKALIYSQKPCEYSVV